MAPAENAHQVRQILRLKKLFSHEILLNVEGTEEPGLLEIQVADDTSARRVMAAAGFGTDQIIAEGNLAALFLSANDIQQHIRGVIIQFAVVGVNGGKPRTGQLGAGQVVKPADQHVPRYADPVFLQRFHETEGHFIICADEGIRQGTTLADPAARNVNTIGGSPGAVDDLYVFIRNAVFIYIFQYLFKSSVIKAAFFIFTVHKTAQISINQ